MNVHQHPAVKAIVKLRDEMRNCAFWRKCKPPTDIIHAKATVYGGNYVISLTNKDVGRIQSISTANARALIREMEYELHRIDCARSPKRLKEYMQDLVFLEPKRIE